jgi:predicted O-linked N-acetylglucosamine transferase (SPINDLY family)
MLSRLLFGWTGRRRGGAPAHASDSVEAFLAEGVGLHRQGRLADAERCYLRVLATNPRNADALNLLGAIAYARLDYESALEYFQSAAALAPAAALYHENVGLALGDLGRLDESLTALRRAQELDPASERIGANLLYLMRVHPAIDEEECFRAHRAWAARHTDTVPRLPPASGRCADPGRRLRIAYVSGDFRAHAVEAFLEPLFTHRDRDAFELYCYRTLREEDARTARFRELADDWHDAFDLADDAFAELIRVHRIDVLVDLSGITRGHRARALARKPAPVQIAYVGYLGSTATSAIDYRITDAHADPPGHSERFHTERLLRLPHVQWAYTPNAAMPEPLSEPLLEPSPGPITFGSFHRLAKLHRDQLALWAELLSRAPGARIELVDIASDDVRARVLEPFLARGVAPERVATHARLERARYWELMRHTHLALDAYPYNGGATTCEALWMGVPVVSRAGRHGFSRSGASILNAIGLPELVATSDADYLQVAVALATDRSRLGALRRGLRDRMRASPLLDARGFMRDLEGAYRQAWREHCAGGD